MTLMVAVDGKATTLAEITDYLPRAVVISLFTWRRADDDDDTELVYGWWGDSYPSVANDRIGSRLYLLRRQKITTTTLQQAEEYIQEALEWLVDDGIASDITIDLDRWDTDAVSAIITITSPAGQQSMTFSDLWSVVNDV